MAMAAGPALGGATAGLAGRAAPQPAYAEGSGAVVTRAGVVERGMGAARRSVLLGWYFWTLPFRIGCSLALLLFVRIVAQPMDFAQDQVLGFHVIAVERTTNRVVDAIRPLWHTIFPFKDRDVSLAAGTAPDAGGPMMDHARQHDYMDQQYPYAQQAMRQQPQAPAYASTRYSGGGDFDPRQRRGQQGHQGRHDPYIAAPPAAPAAQRTTSSSSSSTFGPGEGATAARGPGGGVRRRGRGNHASGASSLSDDLSDDLISEDDSEPSVKLPPAAVHASAAEIDKAVLLAIEAQQTHVVVEKLFYIAVLLMAIVGVVLFRIDFTRNWSGEKIANVEPAMGFEGIYGILLVLTMAFRSDFPFNLGILMLVVFFAGVVFGTIISRNAFAKPLANQDDD